LRSTRTALPPINFGVRLESMSIMKEIIEPLSVNELKRVGRARFVYFFFFIFIASITAPILIHLFTNNSVGKFIALGVLAFLGCIGSLFLVFLNINIWRDFLSGKKLVIRGKVAALETGSHNKGISWYVFLNDNLSTSRKRFTVDRKTFRKLKIGDMVEIAHLIKSDQTLSVTLVPNIAFNTDAFGAG
jgi:hypothetical protein